MQFTVLPKTTFPHKDIKITRKKDEMKTSTREENHQKEKILDDRKYPLTSNRGKYFPLKKETMPTFPSQTRKLCPQTLDKLSNFKK